MKFREYFSITGLLKNKFFSTSTTDSEATKLINFIRGLDSYDEDGDGIPDISRAEEGGEEYIMPQDNRSSLPRTRYERKLQQM